MPWNATTVRSSGFTVTAAVWNDEIVENMQFLEEVAYVAFTSSVSVTATTEAGANQIVSAGAITYENVPHLIEFSSPRVQPGVAGLRMALFDGGTSLGWMLDMPTGEDNPAHLQHRLTPTAASHTYNFRAWNLSAATATVFAGAGGAGVRMPGYIRITRVPT